MAASRAAAFTGCSSRGTYATHMKMALSILIGLGVATAVPPVLGQSFQHRDQQEASRAMRMGHILPLQAIEARILPMMRGREYIGVDFDPEDGIYTLRFLREHEDTVIKVYVDGRTGRIIGRTGN